jgi:hypothetical protein
MDKLKWILRLAGPAAKFLPPPWGQVAGLVGHGVDELFAQIDAERQRQGLSWQELEAQLGAEMTAETKAWDDFVRRLEASGQ